MIKQLESAAYELQRAWENYYQIYSTLNNDYALGNTPRVYGYPQELSRQINTELTFWSSCKPKIRQLEMIMSRVRNYSVGIVPINNLPPEILARIFCFVPEQPCQFYQDSEHTLGFPQFPDYLAQVCSHWRQIATSCPRLWHHIDLSSNKRWDGGLLALAKVHLARAGQTGIELHTQEEYILPFMRRRRDHKELKGLIGDISHRVETLEMVVSHMFGPFHRAILESLFSNGNSALKTLVLHSEGIYKNAFIISTDVVPGALGGDFSRCEVLLTEEQLERAFSTVTVLHACGIFPPWSSTAYHGLVDLRLRSTTRWSDIEETELVSILRSSPGLRILHFELAVRNPAPDTKRVIPVHLLELQVVKVFLSNNSDVSSNSLLRLLAPGSKPLWLSLDGAFKLDDGLNVELDEFFARSRVAKFYANKSILPLNLLLRYSANLECVTFDSFDSHFHHALLVVERTQADELAPLSRLESLRLLHSSLSEESLRILVTYCPSGIVLDTSFVWRGEESQHTMLTGEEILSAFPTVRVSGSSMNSPTVY